MIRLLLMQLFMAIDVNWSSITDPIHDLFFGGQPYVDFNGVNQTTQGIMGNDPMLAGAFIFLVLFLLTLLFGLGMLVGSVVIIPSMFAIFQYIPDMRIVVAIICGLVFGMAIHNLIRR